SSISGINQGSAWSTSISVPSPRPEPKSTPGPAAARICFLWRSAPNYTNLCALKGIIMSALIWTLALLTGLGIFFWQCYGRFGNLLKLRKDDNRNYSGATLATRFRNMMVYAFGQKKFFGRDQPAGIMHVIIFWGFCLLLFQVLTMFGRGWSDTFRVPL